MATLLIWTDDGTTLTIIDSHQVEDGDQATIDELFEDAAERDGASWRLRVSMGPLYALQAWAWPAASGWCCDDVTRAVRVSGVMGRKHSGCGVG